jgi:hypothetical protein
MKQFFIFLIVGIFFLFISGVIFTTKDFAPFDMVKVDNLIAEKGFGPDDSAKLDQEIGNLIANGAIIDYLTANAYLLLFSILATIFCFFVCIHLFIDKLFFKNFYETASRFNAYRRGLLLSISIGSMILMKLYKVELYVIILVPMAAVLFDLMVSRYSRNYQDKQIIEDQESPLESVELGDGLEDEIV